MTKRIVIASLAVAAVSLVTCGRAKAASYQHMDTLAVRIQANSARLYREFQLHYNHAPGYLHLISDARTLYVRAAHVHSVVHVQGSPQHVASDLRIIDRTYHHLEQLLSQIELEVHLGQLGHGHGQTLHVHQLMKQIEYDIHHLREDVEALLQPCRGHGVTVHPGHIIVYPPQRRQFPAKLRNFGEIRSGWKIGLKDL